MKLLTFMAALVLSCGDPLFGAGKLSGRRAPGFSLPDSNFRQYDLQDYRGKVVVLEIMQTNCPHCRDFAKVLEKVKQRYGDRVAVLAIVNPPDTQATVARYVAETGSTIPILFDCGQVAASYLKATPANPSFDVPHVFLIDQDGMIRNDFGYGPATKAIFEGTALFGEIDRLLGKAAPGKGR
ncbi:MAG: TlpA disulfide reductase family protein [Bryobacterales bacterium]|nr:TlpA family protein disulfide reductase [Bryobacteraceae bacterium]MDW8354245.1 TlpA disulfide reductase family protein [Bryobacterales bacterium]